jgi:riboflavin synthase
MFTGIVEERGSVVALEQLTDSARLTVTGPLMVTDISHGASIAVNGVCLTVVRWDGQQFTVDVMAETLSRSTIGSLQPGDPVNLERAMRADGRFGGHVVQGHVDGVGSLESRAPGDRWDDIVIAAPARLMPYIVEKGSITVDGVSLTVTGVDDAASTFGISLIPTTLELTTLGVLSPGGKVNLEVDVLAKYVERLLGARGEMAGAA